MTDVLVVIPARGSITLTNLACARCGGPITGRQRLGQQRKYCSFQCRCRPRIFFTCQCCGTPLQRPKQRKFCSVRCSSKMPTKRFGQDHPRWQPKTLKPCEWCGGPMLLTPWLSSRQRFCSNRCRGSWSVRQKRLITKPEKMFAEELCRQGIRFERNAPIDRFTVDFLLCDAAIAIEVDGAYWHSLPTQIVRDKIKEGVLRDSGIVLLRFSQRQVESDLSGCIRAILTSSTRKIQRHPLLPLFDSAKKVCRVAGCGRDHYGKGLCRIHWGRLTYYGRLTTILTPKNLYTECSIPGCTKPNDTRGLCSMHSSRLKRHGNVEGQRP